MTTKAVYCSENLHSSGKEMFDSAKTVVILMTRRAEDKGLSFVCLPALNRKPNLVFMHD